MPFRPSRLASWTLRWQRTQSSTGPNHGTVAGSGAHLAVQRHEAAVAWTTNATLLRRQPLLGFGRGQESKD